MIPIMNAPRFPPPALCRQSVDSRSLSVGHICMSPLFYHLIDLQTAPLTVQSMGAAPILPFCWSHMYRYMCRFIGDATTYGADHAARQSLKSKPESL